LVSDASRRQLYLDSFVWNARRARLQDDQALEIARHVRGLFRSQRRRRLGRVEKQGRRDFLLVRF
jgi:hypothetical protein